MIKSFLKTRLPLIYRVLRWFSNPTSPIHFGLWIVNFIFQRLFGINKRVSFMVHYTSIVKSPKKIVIGKNVWISFAVSGNCYFQGINGIQIGDDTIFAPGIKIISANHDPKDLARHIPADPIKIGKKCWLGVSAIILPGVELGDGTVVGAGAVVTRSFPANSILVGNPAKNINNETHSQ